MIYKKFFALCLALCILASLPACQEGSSTTTSTPGEDTLYTVSIAMKAGTLPENVQYYVYKDATMQTGILTYGKLDNSGKLEFTAPAGGDYTLVLKNVPEGYNVQPSYALASAHTDISITTAPLQGKDPIKTNESNGQILRYVHGDIIRDFSITDTDGNTYTIAQLLETKKCVVLNFWNIQCDPCKMEFPYLQKAYEAYSDDIALIAMNPVPTDSVPMIQKFKQERGLTFPMASCDPNWAWAFAPGDRDRPMDVPMSNPTTVIIDRYGMICVRETGAIPEEGIFEAVFAHFVAEDYNQQLILDMAAFAQKAQS